MNAKEIQTLMDGIAPVIAERIQAEVATQNGQFVKALLALIAAEAEHGTA